MIDIKNIQDFIKNKRVTKIELKRLNEDLQTVYKRLRKRGYKIGGFSTNKFDVADKSYEIYVNMEFFSKIARTWEVIFKILKINKINTIADLCPGYIPKVEMGLYYAGFTGNVIALDKDPKSLLQLKKFISIFNPKFKTSFRKQNIFKRSRHKYKMLVANHILDDLTLYYFANKRRVDLKTIYQKENALQSFWESILENKQKNLKEIASAIVSSIDSLIQSGGLICLAQYKSYTDKMLDLEGANLFTRKLFRWVYKDLSRKGYKDESKRIRLALDNFGGHFGSKDCLLLRKNENKH